MAFLDGEFVDDDLISPKLHKFIGMFRQPNPPDVGQCDYFLCACGERLSVRGQEREHWHRGCFDSAQYVTIRKSSETMTEILTRWHDAVIG